MIHSADSLYFSTARENLFRGSTVGALQGSCWVAELCSESQESAFCARDGARRELNCSPLHNFRRLGFDLCSAVPATQASRDAKQQEIYYYYYYLVNLFL